MNRIIYAVKQRRNNVRIGGLMAVNRGLIGGEMEV